jgi:ribosomal protein S18 acetylase RimI-like enzyme
MITIRKATKQDFRGIMQIWKQMMDYHLILDPKYLKLARNREKLMQAWLLRATRKKDSNLLVAVDDMVIGYILGYKELLSPVYYHREYGYISDLAVDKKSRKKGIGKELTKEILKWFKSKNLTIVRLKAHTKNTIAIKAYQHMGFKEEDKIMRIQT